MFEVVSCEKCGDTSTRGNWETGCPMCGADEDFVNVQGFVQIPEIENDPTSDEDEP